MYVYPSDRQAHSFDNPMYYAVPGWAGTAQNVKTMNIEELKTKPLWQMTGEEFLYLQGYNTQLSNVTATTTNDYSGDNYAYGIRGIASIFGCSISTANRIKKSGKIDRAIKQVGRKVIVDKKMALMLVGKEVDE